MENIWEVQNGRHSDPQAESQAGRGKFGQKVCNEGVALAFQGLIKSHEDKLPFNVCDHSFSCFSGF